MQPVDRDGQSLAARLRRLHGDVSARELAQIYGVEISRDSWRVADGRLVYLAECLLNPPRIILNTAAIECVSRSAPGEAGEGDRHWFTQSRITEVVIAHELYHILTRQPSAHEIESSAHQFAQSFTGIPFSPLRYEAVLKLWLTF